jgi:hypothetical protein
MKMWILPRSILPFQGCHGFQLPHMSSDVFRSWDSDGTMMKPWNHQPLKFTKDPWIVDETWWNHHEIRNDKNCLIPSPGSAQAEARQEGLRHANWPMGLKRHLEDQVGNVCFKSCSNSEKKLQSESLSEQPDFFVFRKILRNDKIW